MENIDHKFINHSVLIDINCNIDVSNIKDVQTQLYSIIEKDASELIAINFENVNFIDSSGIATLVKILKKIISTKQKLVLYAVKDEIMTTFMLLKLQNFFTIYSKSEFKKKYSNLFE